MLTGAAEKPSAAPQEDPLEVGAAALKEAMASGDSKKIAAAMKAMHRMCALSDDSEK